MPYIRVGRNAAAPAAGRGHSGTSSRDGSGKPKRRRRFTSEYKLRVLMQAGEALHAGRGALSLFLKREGLYSSHLAQWRKQRELGLLGKARRGRPAKSREWLLHENGRLKRKLAYLEACLREDLRPNHPAALALLFRTAGPARQAGESPPAIPWLPPKPGPERPGS